ncbi:vWA domain-containing protein [Nakamurella leprariae]|uniref:VWA domain-containing protein n=1 Tax=Nakamurella leprariae TaxID=2803911 RepID=A0A938YCR2_9ACTN|nr:VWA domain-containing protein [Nakamurella leprariae]MBM9468242.1 VWA domain-containing protein [Nakamurella leprariae]
MNAADGAVIDRRDDGPEEQPDVVETMTGFAWALRAAGVNAGRERLTTCLTALEHVDPVDPEAVYWTCRVSFCSEPDDQARFDAVFGRWFLEADPEDPEPASAGDAPIDRLAARRPPGAPGDRQEVVEEDPSSATEAADVEVLRHRDVALLADAERDEINRMIALLAPRVGRRRTLRRARGGRERLDVGRTVRAMLGTGGEPVRLVRDHRRDKPRRLVLLIDVSGSMAPYADVVLRFAHAAARVSPATEVFTLGTHLTRVTRQLRLRDPDHALSAAGAAIPDWSGGTRLGETLRAFLDRWGQRGLARRAVVVIASDGWERGDAALLGEQMARLARLAHRVVWINPHRGKAGFAPATAGMVAALPSIDDLVAGHSVAALTHVAEVIARA